MVPNGTAYANYPSFANNGTKTPPGGSTESAKYALGMVPADTFPAEWANWLFHGATAGITRLNADVGSIKKEINSLLVAYNVTPDASVFNQLYQAIEKRISSLYPVGTVYQNASNSTNPGDATMLGFGTWEQITDKFLAARGSTNIGASGGAWTVTLSANNIPRHRHQVNNHTHGMQHYHYTDITHGHTLSYYTFNNVGSASEANRFPAIAGNILTSLSSNVDNYSGGKWSGGSCVDYTGTAKTQTDGASPYTDYQYAENPTAISITPTYVGVYTWKRTV